MVFELKTPKHSTSSPNIYGYTLSTLHYCISNARPDHLHGGKLDEQWQETLHHCFERRQPCAWFLTLLLHCLILVVVFSGEEAVHVCKPSQQSSAKHSTVQRSATATQHSSAVSDVSIAPVPYTSSHACNACCCCCHNALTCSVAG